MNIDLIGTRRKNSVVVKACHKVLMCFEFVSEMCCNEEYSVFYVIFGPLHWTFSCSWLSVT